MSRRTAAIAAILLAGLLARTAPAAPAVHMAGGKGVLWVAIADTVEDTTRVSARADGRWRDVERNGRVEVVRGQPAAVTVLGERFHVFFATGAHGVYRLDGEPETGLWPQEWRGRTILAAAAGPAVSGDATRDALYVMLEVEESVRTPPEAPETGPPTTQTTPATTTTAIGPAEPVAGVRRPVIFTLRGGEASRVAAVPVEYLANAQGYDLVAARGSLYLLMRRAEPSARLLRYAAGTWESLDVSGWPEGTRPYALVAAGSDVLIVGLASRPAGTGLVLRRVEAGGLAGEPAIVSQDAEPLSLPVGAEPVLARYGGGLAVAWADAHGQWQFATVALTGRVAEVIGLTPLAPPAAPSWPTRFMPYLPLVLAGLLMLLWLARRRAPAGRAFILPPQFMPAAWGRRMLAFLLEFFPVLLLMQAFLGPEDAPETVAQMLEVIRGGGPVAMQLMVLWFASLAAYAVYAAVLEGLTGATLGKRLLRMRVVNERGEPPGWRAILLRNLTKIVEPSAGFLSLLFVVLPWLSHYHQRLGDILARTTVVDRRPAGEALLVGPMPPGLRPPQEAAERREEGQPEPTPPEAEPPAEDRRPEDERQA